MYLSSAVFLRCTMRVAFWSCGLRTGVVITHDSHMPNGQAFGAIRFFAAATWLHTVLRPAWLHTVLWPAWLHMVLGISGCIRHYGHLSSSPILFVKPLLMSLVVVWYKLC